MRLRDFFRKNIWLKVTSLLLAIFLELYFYGPDNSASSSLVVPIEFTNLPKNLMIVSPRGAEKGMYADVRLRGPRPLIEQIQAKNNRFLFNLGGVETMNHVVFLSPAQLSVPAGVTVEITPERIKLELDKVLRKELEVSVAYRGEPEEGHLLSHFTVEPKKIIADGPTSELLGVKKAETEAIDISGLSSNRSFEVALENRAPLTRYSVNTVTVNFFISPIESVRDFEDVSIKVAAAAGHGVTVEPSRVMVRITGAEAILKQLNRSQIELFADVRDLPAGRHEVKISSKLPPDVQILKTEPETVVVTVIK